MKQKAPDWLLTFAAELKPDKPPPKEKYESWYGFQPTPKHPVLFLRPKALAAQLSVSLKTLERMRKDGSGPPYLRCGKGPIRYPLKELDQWVRRKLDEELWETADEEHGNP